jgi:hypothetical protein
MSKKFKIDMEKIDSKFVDEKIRKEYIIDNFKKVNDGKKIEKNFNNDLLEDKVEKINKIINWYKDDKGEKVEYIEADRLRENFKDYFKDNSIKQLFNTFPKRGGDKKIFENVNTHILKELGYEFISKKKKMKDKATAKIKVVNVYSIGKCKILNDYLERKEAIEAKKEVDE